MSERYTQRFAGIYDNKESRYVDVPNVSAVLNDRDRLAAEVATLRELVNKCRDYFNATGGKPVHLSQAFDAALATRGETP